MKYLFINSFSSYGSTGRLVMAKCRELTAQGHECRIACGRRKGTGQTEFPEIFIGTSWNVRIHGLESRLLDNHAFSSRLATLCFLEKVREYDPDVIWMHNLHGYYIHAGMLFDYLRTSGKTIYWTLHDCWTFTGHCSHFEGAGCTRWKTGCGSCIQKKEYPASLFLDHSRKNYRRKKEAFTGIPNLTIITPCKWLANLVKQSFLGEYPVEVVYNTINTTVFCPTEGQFREKNGLEKKKIVLGVSGMWDNTKGLHHFVNLSQKLGEEYQVVLVGIPEKIKKTLPASVLAISRTESQKALAEIYSAADVFVNPTYEDTLPTVNLEARACGCRIVTFNTGGCAETVGPEDYVLPVGDENMLLETIQRVCEGEE